MVMAKQQSTTMPVSAQETRQRILKHVCEQIQSGQWPVGHRVATDMELATLFKTSVTNANQAMKWLEGQGIIRRFRRRGTFVASVPKAEIHQMVEHQKRSSRLVHVMAPDVASAISMHWNTAALAELETVLNASGYQLSHKQVPRQMDLKAFEEVVHQAALEQSRGLVILSSLVHGESCKDADLLPFVSKLMNYPGRVCWLNRAGYPLGAWPFDAVSFSPLSQGFCVGRYIAQNRVDSVICLTNAHNNWAAMRMTGVKFALREDAGSSSRIQVNDFPADTQTGPEETARRLFKSLGKTKSKTRSRPTIVALNDIWASSLLEVGAKLGWKCPEDFCVIGFDNDDRYRHHNITTVATPSGHLGETIGQLISDQLRHPDNAAVHLSLKSIVIERSTFTSSAS